MKAFRIFVLCLFGLLPLAAYGQAVVATPPSSGSGINVNALAAPTPVSTAMNFSVGASALGLGGTSQTTPASDVTLKLGFNKYISLRSDNLLAPGANLQYYGGGVEIPLPNSLLKNTTLANLNWYTDATVGVDRIVPASGPSQSHIAFMAGGGLRWSPSSGVTVNLVEVNVLHAPGAAWGSNTPAVSGGITYLFGK